MMRNKKKGFALIYVLCISALVLVMATSVVELVASNRQTTSNLDKSNKEHLAAVAGVNAAVSKIKTYISTNYTQYANIKDQIQNNSTINDYNIPSDYVKDANIDEGASYHVTIFPKNYTDPLSGKTNVRCLEVTSKGTYKGSSKTITVEIDEHDISNVYFDNLFTKPLQIATDSSSTSNPLPMMGVSSLVSGNADIASISEDKNKYKVYPETTGSVPSMIIYKCSTKSPKEPITLKSLTDGMYNYVFRDSDIHDNIDQYNTDTSITQILKNAELDDYVNTVKNANGSNDLLDMLKFSRFYKVLLIDGDIDVGKIDFPLVNYIIYCTGTVNVSSSSNLRMWNCDIYAKNITYDDGNLKFRVANNDELDELKNKIHSKYDVVFMDDNGKDLAPGAKNIEIKGIATADAKETLLKYITNSDVDSSIYDAIHEYEQTQDAKDINIFPSEAAGQFTPQDRQDSNNYFYGNLSNYQYGLKIRFIDWKEN